MLKIHKNELLRIVDDEGFAPSEFQASEHSDGGRSSFVIKHRLSPFRFVVRELPHDYHRFNWQFTRFAPGFPLSDLGGPAHGGDMSLLSEAVEHWLSDHLAVYLNEEEAPDLWAQASALVDLGTLGDYSGSEAAAFSPGEREAVRAQVRELRVRVVATFAPSPSQLEDIDERLGYLTEAIDRLNRFDWRGVLVNTLLSIVIALSLSTSQGRALFEIAQAVFARVRIGP